MTGTHRAIFRATDSSMSNTIVDSGFAAPSATAAARADPTAICRYQTDGESIRSTGNRFRTRKPSLATSSTGPVS